MNLKTKKFDNYALTYDKTCRMSTFSFDEKFDIKIKSKIFPQQSRYQKKLQAQGKLK